MTADYSSQNLETCLLAWIQKHKKIQKYTSTFNMFEALCFSFLPLSFRCVFLQDIHQA